MTLSESFSLHKIPKQVGRFIFGYNSTKQGVPFPFCVAPRDIVQQLSEADLWQRRGRFASSKHLESKLGDVGGIAKSSWVTYGENISSFAPNILKNWTRLL